MLAALNGHLSVNDQPEFEQAVARLKQEVHDLLPHLRRQQHEAADLLGNILTAAERALLDRLAKLPPDAIRRHHLQQDVGATGRSATQALVGSAPAFVRRSAGLAAGNR